MVRVGISVEGTAEERFVQIVLAPYLAKKQVSITPISMGGDVKLGRVEKQLRKLRKCWIVIMIDKFILWITFYNYKKHNELLKVMGND